MNVERKVEKKNLYADTREEKEEGVWTDIRLCVLVADSYGSSKIPWTNGTRRS